MELCKYLPEENVNLELEVEYTEDSCRSSSWKGSDGGNRASSQEESKTQARAERRVETSQGYYKDKVE